MVSDGVAVGYQNPLSGPITVAGGTIDTVTTVTNPVTAGGGSIATVTNPVVAGSGTIDTVNNPVVAGSGNVDNVKATVPTSSRDVFYWPAITGESFPPTFSSVTYSQSEGIPAYSFPATAVSATFPHIPRYTRLPSGGADRRNVTIKFRAWISNTALLATTFFQWGANSGGAQNGPGVTLGFDASGNLILGTGGPGAAQTVQALAAGSVTKAVWIDIQIDIDPNGNVALTWGGVLLVSIISGARWVYNSATTTFGVQPSFKSPASAAGAQSYFTQLQFTWS